MDQRRGDAATTRRRNRVAIVGLAERGEGTVESCIRLVEGVFLPSRVARASGTVRAISRAMTQPLAPRRPAHQDRDERRGAADDPRRRRLRDRSGRRRRGRRRVGIRQDHAARASSRGSTVRRSGDVWLDGHALSRARRGRACGAAPASARFRLPVVPASAAAHRARERDASARARRRGRCRGERAGMARARRAREAHDALPEATVRRRAAAGRDRACVRGRAQAADGRRADRQPRQCDRDRSDRSHVPSESRARHHAAPRHARRRPRRTLRARLSLGAGRLVGDDRLVPA